MKYDAPPTLTDRELFVAMELGDPWHDAQMTEVWAYLYNHAGLSIPCSWQQTMREFDVQLMSTLA